MGVFIKFVKNSCVVTSTFNSMYIYVKSNSWHSYKMYIADFQSPSMDDLERYKEKINQVEDSSLESTRNMLAMMEEVRGRQKKNGSDNSVCYYRPRPRGRAHCKCWMNRDSSWTGSRATSTPSTQRWSRPRRPWPRWRSGVDCSRAHGIGSLFIKRYNKYCTRSSLAINV